MVPVLRKRLPAWNLENPVLGKEFRTRMRGVRSFMVTGGYAAAVIGVLLIAYFLLAREGSSLQLAERAAHTGRWLWTWGCCVQALLLPLTVPAFTVGAITLEREREMLDALLLTRLTPGQVCAGKLWSGVGLGFLLALTSVPSLSLVFVLGGVSPVEMLQCLAVLLSAILVSGCLGLLCSSLARRTVHSTLWAYLLAGGNLLGLPILFWVLQGIFSASNSLAAMEGGILLLLLLHTILSAGFAFGLMLAAGRIYERRSGQLLPRVRRLVLLGVFWVGLLLPVYLPGADGLLQQGSMLLYLHPPMVILATMHPEATNLTAPHLWAAYTAASLAVAAWAYVVAVIQIRRAQSG